MVLQFLKILLVLTNLLRTVVSFFEFHSNHCAVKSQVTNEVLLQGNVGPDGLDRFSFSTLLLLLLVLPVFPVQKIPLLIHVKVALKISL